MSQSKYIKSILIYSIYQFILFVTLIIILNTASILREVNNRLSNIKPEEVKTFLEDKAILSLFFAVYFIIGYFALSKQKPWATAWVAIPGAYIFTTTILNITATLSLHGPNFWTLVDWLMRILLGIGSLFLIRNWRLDRKILSEKNSKK